jgi:hypothetical protein
MNRISDTANKALNVVKANPYVSGAAALSLVMFTNPWLLEHSLVKLMVSALVLMLLKTRDYRTAVIVVVGFAVAMLASRHKVLSHMAVDSSNFVQNHLLGHTVPEVKVETVVMEEEPEGYPGHDFATIGGEDSQL